jgi:uncharacterized repeat protein (TIGR03803 family)
MQNGSRRHSVALRADEVQQRYNPTSPFGMLVTSRSNGLNVPDVTFSLEGSSTMSQQVQKSSFHTNLRAAATAFGVLVALTLTAIPVPAQTFTVLHNFTDGQDGRYPLAGVSIDKAGNLYGTASGGGSAGGGTVFKLSHKGSGWTFTPLYSFLGADDGAEPYARVVFGPDRSLYGTTNSAANLGCFQGYGCGTVFNLRPPPSACKTALCPWSETVLYSFTGGSDGGNPWGADLVFDQVGSLYGTTAFGGKAGCSATGCGVVYKLTPSSGGWTETVLYSFTGGNDGGNPAGGVIFDQAGNLYGVTTDSGPSRQGTVYELTPSGSGWTENTIFDPQNFYGSQPIGGLVFDVYGNLFGATSRDSVNLPWYPGTLFEIGKLSGNWILRYAYDFSGDHPVSGVTADGAGNLYGNAYADPGNQGVPSLVYKLEPSNGSWSFGFVYEFPQGTIPSGVVVVDASGNIYGTTQNGGEYGFGVVWEITP